MARTAAKLTQADVAPAPRPRWKYLNREVTRHSGVIWFVARPGWPRIRIYAEPDTPAFRQAYLDAFRGIKHAPKARKHQRPTGDQGYVYFALAGSDDIKIGYSADPKKRVADLSTANSSALRIALIVEGCLSLEAEYHRRFSKYRLRGEWFRFEGELKKFVLRGSDPVIEL